MVNRMTLAMVGLSLAMLPAKVVAEESVPSPPSEICAGNAGWADDDAEEVAREFDWHFTAFSKRFTGAFAPEAPMLDDASILGLRVAMEDTYRALTRLIPMREAGNEAWPMKFLLGDIPGGVPLPDFEPPDRQEVLRAAFLRELVSVALPGPERSKVRFFARLGTTRMLLDVAGESGGSESNEGALRILANGLLVESYETDFRRPALHVLDDGWHTSLASRLRVQVMRMCRETER